MGDTLTVRTGMDYKVMNGAPEKPVRELTFTVREQGVWELQTRNSNISLVHVGTVDGSINMNAMLVGSTGAPVVMNKGTAAVTGVRFVWGQGKTAISGGFDGQPANNPSAKINLKAFALYVERDDTLPGAPPAWGWYKVGYNIVDTRGTCVTADDVSRETVWDEPWQSASAGTADSKKLTLPELKANCYISEVVIVPMGTNGTEEGVLAPGNGICLRPDAKNWPGRRWPDGTQVQEWSRLYPSFKMIYDDNPNAPGDYDESKISATWVPKDGNGEELYGEFYYSSSSSGLGRMRAVDRNKRPGETVTYEIQGNNFSPYYMDDKSAPRWESPRLVARVPAFMTLKGLENAAPGDGRSTKLTLNTNPAFPASETVTADVTATLAGKTETHNYYSFQTEDYNAFRTAVTQMPSWSFRFNAEFTIEPGAAPGTYNTAMLATSRDAAKFMLNGRFYTTANNLPDPAEKSLFGLGDGEFYNYNGSPSDNHSITIESEANISGKTTMASEYTGGVFVDARVVPAMPSQPQQVRLRVTNSGNAPLNNVRLYNILPHSGDSLGSDGTISLQSAAAVEGSVTPTIYYYTGGSHNAYGYHADRNGAGGPSLQGAAFWSSWSKINQAERTTAIFVDFGSEQLPAQDSWNIILTFAPPESATDQTALNQFRYSAKEVGTASVIEGNSPVAGYSTKAIGIVYDGNEPASAIDTMAPIYPTSAIIGFDPAVDSGLGEKDALRVHAVAPALTGHEFISWNTAPGGDGDALAPGALRKFSGAGMLTLYAQWKASKYTVSYDANTGSGTMGSDTATYNANFQLTANAFSKPRHTFTGWNTVADGSGTGYADEYAFTPWKLTEDLKLYAQWEEIEYVMAGYTVHHYLEGTTIEVAGDDTGTGAIGESVTVTALNPLPTGYVRANNVPASYELLINEDADENEYTFYYVFTGWDVSLTPGTFTYNGTARSLTAVAETLPDSVTPAVQYRIDGGAWQGAMPARTDAGTYTVEAQVSADGYGTKTAAATLTVSPVQVTLTGNSGGYAYGAAPPSASASPNVAITGGMAPLVYTVQYQTGGGIAVANPAASGTYYSVVTAAAASNPNYNITTVNGTVTVAAAPAAPAPAPVAPAAPVVPAAGVPAAPIAPIAPVAPAAPDGEIIPDPETPLAEPEAVTPEAEPETQVVEETETPLAVPENTATWPLLNLLIAIWCLVSGVLMAVTVMARGNKKTGLVWRIISIVAGAAAPTVFFLTENLSNPMAFVDGWTLLMFVILAVQAVGMALLKVARRRQNDENTYGKA